MLGSRVDSDSGRVKALLLALVTAVGLILGLAALPQAAQATPSRFGGEEPKWEKPEKNPHVRDKCGLDIAVVVDRSGSIQWGPNGATDLGTLKDAINGLAGGFVGTGSEISLISFSDTATTDVPPTVINSDADANVFRNAVAAWTSAGSTNWQAALREVTKQSDRPDLVLFLTDGRPNTVLLPDGTPSVPGDFRAWPDDFSETALGAAIAQANELKDPSRGGRADSRILAVAVGAANNTDGVSEFGQRAISLISGGREFAEGDGINDFDFIRVARFALLKEKLLQLVNGMCVGIDKKADDDKVEPGDRIKYTVKLTNDRRVPVTSDLVDVLPDGVTFERSSLPGATVSADGKTVTWTGVTVRSRDSRTVSYWVKVTRVNPPSTLTNKATWASQEDSATVKVKDKGHHKSGKD